MNKTEVIQKAASKRLMDEIDELVRLSELEEWEEPHTVETAFDQVDDHEWFPRDVLKVHIALGHYKPITDEKYDSIICSHGKAKSHPKVDGVRYEWVG